MLVIQRDEDPTIPYPGHWDLPGGGREGAETPEECVLRETWEEVGLTLLPQNFTWARRYERPRGTVWFFATHMPREATAAIRFGDEGQRWDLMSPRAFCADPLTVPHFRDQMTLYLESPQFLSLSRSGAGA